MEMQLPLIPGISARPFGPDEDFQLIADLVMAEAQADGQDDGVTSFEDVAVQFRNTENMDLTKDFRFVEVGDFAVGYVITRWWDETDGPRVYRHMCKVRPNWRNRGIGTAMLGWAQGRLAERAATHTVDREKVYRTDIEDTAAGGTALIEGHGYKAIQHGATLVRPHLRDIPRAFLAEGLEIRPVEDEQLRAIWEADMEAFRDHWGFAEPTEKDWQAFLDFPHRDESMWKIAWDGNRVAGQVRSFINQLENRETNRRRGWTEFISTAREWRGKGVATALICESLKELAERGMEEAALGVHVENPHGAYRLYQSLGFDVTSSGTTYEKPLP